MPEPSASRFRGLFSRQRKLPNERDWERAKLLEPRLGPPEPELVSDGAGLPFAPRALRLPPEPLHPRDPAVEVLITQLARRRAPADDAGSPDLSAWRLLARTDDEVLFGHGQPPRLVTFAVRREGRQGVWKLLAASTGRPLRATRERVRASGWRLDPDHEPEPQDAVIRILVTEQASAGGLRADARLLPPDLYLAADEAVLTVFVSPPEGFQNRYLRNPETPVRIELPGPIGRRRLIDGALWPRAAGDD